MIPEPTNTGGHIGDNLLPQTPASSMIAPPRADFDKNRYDTIIAQKGVDVLIEKALQCPCRTYKVNSLSSCKNCGGIGWVFVNPRVSRVVVQGMNFENKEEVWSRLVHGVIKISAGYEEKLGYMDRVTRLNADAIFSEIAEVQEYEEGVSASALLSYSIKELEYVGLFQGTSEKFLQLNPSQYEVLNNKVIITDLSVLPEYDEENPITVTVRYIYAPTFHIVEFNREAIDNYRWTGKGEKLQQLPVLALARRAQDIEELEALREHRLNDNSYEDGLSCDDNIYRPPVCNGGN